MENPHIGSTLEDFLKEEGIYGSANKAALAAWNHYQATGLHVTGAEADASLPSPTFLTPQKPEILPHFGLILLTLL
jgi:predicted transcriptional regulator